jgi:hypothetical protein
MQVPVNHIEDCCNIPVEEMSNALFNKINVLNDYYRLELFFQKRLERFQYNPYKPERTVHGNNKTRRKKQKNQTAR